MGLAVFVVEYASDVMTFELTNRMLYIIFKGIKRVTKRCYCHLLKLRYEEVMIGLKYRKNARTS